MRGGMPALRGGTPQTSHACHKEQYPDGMEHAEVAAYMKAYHCGKEYTRIRKGVEQKVAMHNRGQPGRVFVKRLLKQARFSLQKKSSTRQRPQAIDDSEGVWASTVAWIRRVVANKQVPLHFMKDSDEMCIFWCGHLGWKMHNYCLGKKGQVGGTKVKGQPNARKTLTLNLTSSASGQLRAALVMAKDQDFGLESASGRKLHSLRDLPYPTGGRMHDRILVHSNATGFLTQESYNALVMQDQFKKIREEELRDLPRPDLWGFWMDDSTEIHSGTHKVPGEPEPQPNLLHEGVYYDQKSYLKAKNHILAKVDPGYTNWRPNDQKFINCLFRRSALR